MKPSVPSILLIAGLDPTGKAGLLRDAEICRQLNKSFFSIPTALTVQNNKKVSYISYPEASFYQKSFSLINFKKLKAVKIGMLGNEKIVTLIINQLKKIKKQNPKIKIVWDPIIQSSSGYPLITRKGFKLAVEKLLPLVDVVTPNIPEAEELIKLFPSPLRGEGQGEGERILQQLHTTYQKPIYLKGGHLPSRSEDYLMDGKKIIAFKTKKFNKKIRGTGCVFSTALACYLSEGYSLEKACRKAKEVMHQMFKQ